MYRPEINADRPIAERADSQGECEPDPLVDVAADPAHHIRRVHVRSIENSSAVEHRKQARCGLCHERAVRDAEGRPRRSCALSLSKRECALRQA